MSEIDETADLGDDAEPESFAQRPKQPVRQRAKRSKQRESAPPQQTEAVFDDILASPGKEVPQKASSATTGAGSAARSDDRIADERVEAPATPVREYAPTAVHPDTSAKASAADSRAMDAPPPIRPAPAVAPAVAAAASPRVDPMEPSPIEPLESPRHVAPRPRPASTSALPPASSRAPAFDDVSEPAAPRPEPAPAPLPEPLSSPPSRRAAASEGASHVAVQPRGGDFDLEYDRRSRPGGLAAEPSQPPSDGLDVAEARPSGGDLSRSPTLASGGALSCPFPKEAKRVGVDAAVVTLRVEVEADDRVDNVIILTDPGDGFGREARRCALAKRWRAGLDRAGNAARRTTVVSVRFLRNG